MLQLEQPALLARQAVMFLTLGLLLLVLVVLVRGLLARRSRPGIVCRPSVILGGVGGRLLLTMED